MVGGWLGRFVHFGEFYLEHFNGPFLLMILEDPGDLRGTQRKEVSIEELL